MPSGFLKDLVDHKSRVAGYMQWCANDLSHRASVHDNSKFGEEEFEPYDAAFSELQKYPYGSEELKAVYKSIKPALQHHFEANDHHVEHFENGINDMTTIQLTEMICDWLASSERSQTSIMTGLEINKEKYGIDDQTYRIIVNTAKHLAPEKFQV